MANRLVRGALVAGAAAVLGLALAGVPVGTRPAPHPAADPPRDAASRTPQDAKPQTSAAAAAMRTPSEGPASRPEPPAAPLGAARARVPTPEGEPPAWAQSRPRGTPLAARAEAGDAVSSPARPTDPSVRAPFRSAGGSPTPARPAERERPARSALSGRVLAPDGSPHPGPFWVAVAVRRDDGLPAPPTGLWRFPASAGTFTLSLPPAVYRVVAGADGRPSSEPLDVDLADDEAPAAAVVLTLPAGRTLRGRLVLAPDDLPLGPVELRARGAVPELGPATPEPPATFTGPDGAFTWEGLPAGCREAEILRAGVLLGRVGLPTEDGECLLRLDAPGLAEGLDRPACK